MPVSQHTLVEGFASKTCPLPKLHNKAIHLNCFWIFAKMLNAFIILLTSLLAMSGWLQSPRISEHWYWFCLGVVVKARDLLKQGEPVAIKLLRRGPQVINFPHQLSIRLKISSLSWVYMVRVDLLLNCILRFYTVTLIFMDDWQVSCIVYPCEIT